jgi:hypothetical protein
MRAIFLAVLLIAAACSGGPVATPTPTAAPVMTPSAAVTPTARPTPSQEAELIGACHGRTVAWAAPYAGRIHPLLIAGPWGTAGAWDWINPDLGVNQKWSEGEWTNSMIQLMVCPEPAEPVADGSCGTYQIASGESGELLRFKAALMIRVVIARTGETLQSKTLLGPAQKCPTSRVILGSDPPPWSFLQPSVTLAQIEDYAAKVSAQPVE